MEIGINKINTVRNALKPFPRKSRWRSRSFLYLDEEQSGEAERSGQHTALLFWQVPNLETGDCAVLKDSISAVVKCKTNPMVGSAKISSAVP